MAFRKQLIREILPHKDNMKFTVVSEVIEDVIVGIFADKTNGLTELNLCQCYSLTNEQEDKLSEMVLYWATEVAYIRLKKVYTLGNPSLKVAQNKDVDCMYSQGCGNYISRLYFLNCNHAIQCRAWLKANWETYKTAFSNLDYSSTKKLFKSM